MEHVLTLLAAGRSVGSGCLLPAGWRRAGSWPAWSKFSLDELAHSRRLCGSKQVVCSATASRELAGMDETFSRLVATLQTAACCCLPVGELAGLDYCLTLRIDG